MKVINITINDIYILYGLMIKIKSYIVSSITKNNSDKITS